MDVNSFGHKFIGVPLASNSLHNDPLIEKTVLELDTSNTSDSIPFSESLIIVFDELISVAEPSTVKFPVMVVLPETVKPPVTATSFVGDGSGLTGLSSMSINTKYKNVLYIAWLVEIVYWK